MSSGRTIFLRLLFRAGAALASSSSAWYSFWWLRPFFQAFDSSQAIAYSSSSRT
jgi:hypothetical protein